MKSLAISCGSNIDRTDLYREGADMEINCEIPT